MESRGFDKLEEDKIIAQQCSQSTFVPFRNMVSQIPPIMPTPRIAPIKHLSEVKMWAHREKGICYNCDEKSTHGHQCDEKNLYLLDVASLAAPRICDDAHDAVNDQVNI